ncbi:MAG: ribulose-phosphate 3-epimerase [Clostridia bacterium]|nr:ribulose-phosphate 3-epimerase [Clostridia bacterium]
MEEFKYGDIKLSGSILNVNPLEVHSKIIEADGLLDYIHIDVMDGLFVPNRTNGIKMFKDNIRLENKPFDVHLMVEDPLRELSNYIGASIITFHIETLINSKTMQLDMDQFYDISREIKRMGAKVGIAIKPNTTVSFLRNLLNKVDLVLVMTVEPGFGGQKLIESTLNKIEKVREMGFEGMLEVDGGITPENALSVIQKGANVIVAGTSLFGADDVYDAAWTIKQK